jgi:hypothetical protein
MDFIRAFNTSAIQMIVFAGIIVCGTIIGKKLRDRKDEKDAAQ